MTGRNEMTGNEEKMVLCQDVLCYMKEHDATLEQAYEEIGVPEDMQMTIIEIIEFLYPAKNTEKSLEELLLEHIDD